MRYFWETYINKFIAPEKVQAVLTGLRRSDIITPGTSTVGFVQDYNALSFARFQCALNRALVNAFIMSGLSFPPNARFVLLCHLVTPPYSARRRLPRPKS